MVVFANSLGSLPAGPAAVGGSRITVEKLVMEVPQSSRRCYYAKRHWIEFALFNDY